MSNDTLTTNYFSGLQQNDFQRVLLSSDFCPLASMSPVSSLIRFFTNRLLFFGYVDPSALSAKIAVFL